MIRLIKFSLILAAIVSLSACRDQVQYKKLLSSPQDLQTVVMGCTANDSAHCQRAMIAAQILNQYTSLQRIYVQQYQFDRSQMQQIQAMAMSRDFSQNQALFDRFAAMQDDVQAGFAKLIMATENQIAKTKEDILKTNQKLRVLSTNATDQRNVLSTQVKTLQTKLDRQNQQLTAMYALLQVTLGDMA